MMPIDFAASASRLPSSVHGSFTNEVLKDAPRRVGTNVVVKGHAANKLYKRTSKGAGGDSTLPSTRTRRETFELTVEEIDRAHVISTRYRARDQWPSLPATRKIGDEKRRGVKVSGL